MLAQTEEKRSETELLASSHALSSMAYCRPDAATGSCREELRGVLSHLLSSFCLTPLAQQMQVTDSLWTCAPDGPAVSCTVCCLKVHVRSVLLKTSALAVPRLQSVECSSGA